MAVYEINEAQNNANKVNTNKDLVAGYANQQVEETLQKEAAKAVEKTGKAEGAVRLGDDNKVQSRKILAHLKLTTLFLAQINL